MKHEPVVLVVAVARHLAQGVSYRRYEPPGVPRIRRNGPVRPRHLLHGTVGVVLEAGNMLVGVGDGRPSPREVVAKARYAPQGFHHRDGSVPIVVGNRRDISLRVL